MFNTTTTKVILALVSTTLFWLGGGMHKVVANNLSNEVSSLTDKKHAKYPGHFMNDFVKAFYKNNQEIETEETELSFTINFTVTESGQVDNITVPGITDSSISEEVVRTVKSLKKWKPATEGKTAIASRYSVPFYINLSDVKSGNSKPLYYAKKEDSLYQMATYPGGIDAFWKEYNKKRGPSGEANFVGDRLKYTITVTIEKDGTMTSPQVKGVDNDRHQQGVSEEFMNIVGKMTKWFPAMYDGKPIRSKMNFTFTNNVSILEV